MTGGARTPDGTVRPRRGMSTVAALSSELVHENHRGDESWSQTFRFGIPDQGPVSIKGRGSSGTSVTFHAEIAGPSTLTEHDVRAFPCPTWPHGPWAPWPMVGPSRSIPARGSVPGPPVPQDGAATGPRRGCEAVTGDGARREEKRQRFWTGILVAGAGSGAGTRISRIPFSYAAWMSFSETPSGSERDRAKEPTRSSCRT